MQDNTCTLIFCDELAADALLNASEIVVEHPQGKIALAVETNDGVVVVETNIRRYVCDVINKYSTIDQKFASLINHAI